MYQRKNSLCIVFAISQFNILIKGTLATIYRQRGSLRDCEAVLDVELDVLVRLTRSSEGASAQQVCSQMCYAHLQILF